MKILLAYLVEQWTPPYHLEKALRAEHNVYVANFKSTPYWGDWKFRLPFYIPKGFPVSLCHFQKMYGTDFDLILEVTTSGQYHLTGYHRTKAARAVWLLDVYRYDQRRFQLKINRDFDFTFISQKNFLNYFREGKSFWLPYASDPGVFKKHPLQKIYDIVFIGNINPVTHPERVELLEYLKTKFDVKVFAGKYYGDEAAKIYSQARIVFNKTCAGEINMRIFDTLACGTFLVTDRLKPETGLEELFIDGKHLSYYNDKKELVNKVAYYLNNEKERETIAAEGQKEVYSKHTYAHRSQKLLKVINEHI